MTLVISVAYGVVLSPQFEEIGPTVFSPQLDHHNRPLSSMGTGGLGLGHILALLLLTPRPTQLTPPRRLSFIELVTFSGPVLNTCAVRVRSHYPVPPHQGRSLRGHWVPYVGHWREAWDHPSKDTRLCICRYLVHVDGGESCPLLAADVYGSVGWAITSFGPCRSSNSICTTASYIDRVGSRSRC